MYRSLLRGVLLAAFYSLLLLLHVQPITAQTEFRPQIKPSLAVSRRAGEITIDGDVSDPGWANAAIATDFTQSFPLPNMKPPVSTRALITYDDDNLYIAMIADDPDPSSIRASRTVRDNGGDNDFMGIILDTYGDGTRAFEIYCNPLGIQEDLFWTQNNEDGSYDIVYQSEAKITATGWQMEMKIPFRSLRFPDLSQQHFHATFWRSYPREKTYKMSWAAINFQVPCPFCQFGTLTGIENIHPSGSLELLPSIVGSQQALRHDGVASLVNEKVEVNPSFGARYALGTATALEASINPDFSQVESDAAQISANTTLALFYPERRPFFQDGADLFNTNIFAVYTRSINSPIVAAKAIIRNEATSISYIGAVDEHSPMLIPLTENTVVLPDVGRSLSNILRVQHSFGDNRVLGMLANVRNYEHGGISGVFGFDGHAQLVENIEVSGQVLYSDTKEQSLTIAGLDTSFDHGKFSDALDGERYNGFAQSYTIQRFTPTLDIQLNAGNMSPTFRTPNGFVTTTDVVYFSDFFGYKWYVQEDHGLMRLLSEFDISFSTNSQFEYNGARKLFAIKPEIDLGFIGQSNLHLYYRLWSERFHSVQFNRLGFFDVYGDTRPAEWLSFSWDVSSGTNIARFLDIPVLARTLDLSFSAKIKPVAGLTIEPNYAYEQLRSEDGSSTLVSGAIYRAKVTYQFSREFSARTIVQYDGFGRALEIDPLLTYQLNPFSSIYLGSSHDYRSFDPNMTTLQPSERHFFAKIQYLIQG
ncbi:MAG: carbohydrate binding family 9 domain-containing protein [Bacteroidetes bacterium]|nr:carbohydrate binding family 9 domain-containing protein [Bacteroidota bacterium]